MGGTNATIGGGGYHHVAVRVADYDGAVRFYTALGFVPTLSWGEGAGRAVMLDTGDGACLEVFAGGAADPGQGGTLLHVALRTTDCDGAIARARRAGAEVTMEPKDVDIPTRPSPTLVRIAFCRAPDGTVLEFFQSRAA